MVTEIYLTIPHMMMFCRGSFIWFFPIQHIFYKCGHTCNTLLVKGCGLFNSNAFLGSLSVLSWYTRFHFLDNSVGSIFFNALHLYFCLVLCHCTCKYIKDQTCAIYLCNDIYQTVDQQFWYISMTSFYDLHYFTYSMSFNTRWQISRSTTVCFCSLPVWAPSSQSIQLLVVLA